MPKSNPKVLPIRGASNKPLSTRNLSDSERLAVEKGLAALDAIVGQASVAANELVLSVMRNSEMFPEDGWMFNRQKMRWEKYPVPADA